MSRNGLKVPYLILVQSLRLAFLIIDFNGPAVTPATSDACSLPNQAVRIVKTGRIGQVGLAVIDNQPLLTKVVNAQGATKTIVSFLLALVGNGDFVEKLLGRCWPVKVAC